jgi:hypothetical protein
MISHWTKDEWLSRIAEHIPTNIRLILIAPHTATPAQLKLLLWSNTGYGMLIAP